MNQPDPISSINEEDLVRNKVPYAAIGELSRIATRSKDDDTLYCIYGFNIITNKPLDPIFSIDTPDTGYFVFRVNGKDIIFIPMGCIPVIKKRIVPQKIVRFINFVTGTEEPMIKLPIPLSIFPKEQFQAEIKFSTIQRYKKKKDIPKIAICMFSKQSKISKQSKEGDHEV